jgi:hypothetical protein
VNKDENFIQFINANKNVPKRSIYLSFFLLLTGLVLFIIGCFSDKRYVYWIATFLVEIPGIYFSQKACRAYSAKDKNKRNTLLGDIPTM